MNKLNHASPPHALFRDHYLAHNMIDRLSNTFSSTLLTKPSKYDLVVVCIGTDRSTGDSLGPLVGTKLQKLAPKRMNIYGTLDEPVHAMNLEETVRSIYETHDRPYIVAIDACLGELKSVGMITLGKGPIKPGAGVKKQLPEVGDVHVTGIVNVGGFMEYFVLQNTRLSVVMNMADRIATSLFLSSRQLEQKKEALRSEELPL